MYEMLTRNSGAATRTFVPASTAPITRSRKSCEYGLPIARLRSNKTAPYESQTEPRVNPLPIPPNMKVL